MKHHKPVFDVVAALRLRGMKVIKQGQKVIIIDHPSSDFKHTAVEITESLFGQRETFYTVQFNGFTVRWNNPL
ncbi:hypothetical protein [Shewanella algae]|uniref:hypothetical protein n=1 Tax=Shewanella algae TaxID=38313 RepID=UPI001AADF24F|nr:hypothetical protein [Shewanella algae]MBO2611201.1 hypothetical protein [Shewanella algae]MBO2695513.1 hypothetical protein [Shewanella algae]